MSSNLIQMCVTLLGRRIWWMLTKCMQNGSFHLWIENVWVAGKTVCSCAIQPRITPMVTVKSSLSVGRCAFANYLWPLYTDDPGERWSRWAGTMTTQVRWAGTRFIHPLSLTSVWYYSLTMSLTPHHLSPVATVTATYS